MTHDPVDGRTGARLTVRVSRWDDDLAVRLPAKLVDELGLKEGSELNVVAAGERKIEAEAQKRAFLEALTRLRARNWTPPEGYRFDREEANKR